MTSVQEASAKKEQALQINSEVQKFRVICLGNKVFPEATGIQRNSRYPGIIKAIPETGSISYHWKLLLVFLLLTFPPIGSSLFNGRDLKAPKNVFVQETTT